MSGLPKSLDAVIGPLQSRKVTHGRSNFTNARIEPVKRPIDVHLGGSPGVTTGIGLGSHPFF